VHLDLLVVRAEQTEHRRIEPQRFFKGDIDERRIGTDRLPTRPFFEQTQHAIGDE
jgi:hypothetical protein